MGPKRRKKRKKTRMKKPKILRIGVRSFPEAKTMLRAKGRAHTIVTDRETGHLYVVRNLDLHLLSGGRYIQEPI
jgi:hypothetical protein